jgi:hypothetical protein
MQEGVTAVWELDEAEAFVRIVPLDRRSDGWTGGAVELGAVRRRVSKIAGRRFVVSEITAAGRVKISVSAAHVDHLGECARDSFG